MQGCVDTDFKLTSSSGHCTSDNAATETTAPPVNIEKRMVFLNRAEINIGKAENGDSEFINIIIKQQDSIHLLIFTVRSTRTYFSINMYVVRFFTFSFCLLSDLGMFSIFSTFHNNSLSVCVVTIDFYRFCSFTDLLGGLVITHFLN